MLGLPSPAREKPPVTRHAVIRRCFDCAQRFSRPARAATAPPPKRGKCTAVAQNQGGPFYVDAFPHGPCERAPFNRFTSVVCPSPRFLPRLPTDSRSVIAVTSIRSPLLADVTEFRYVIFATLRVRWERTSRLFGSSRSKARFYFFVYAQTAVRRRRQIFFWGGGLRQLFSRESKKRL